MTSRIGIGILSLLLLAGCGGDPAGELPGSRVSLSAVREGCRIVCPSPPVCPEGVPCPMPACGIVCPDDISPCGPATCGPGLVCCNESCGICTPPDGVCIQLYCEPEGNQCGDVAVCRPGFEWSKERCACVPSTPPPLCRKDADCRLFSDYCTGCDCRGLVTREAEPNCGLPGVRCVADPCGGQRAACVAGQCVAQPRCRQPVACRSGWQWSEERCACLQVRPARAPRPPRPARPTRPIRPERPA